LTPLEARRHARYVSLGADEGNFIAVSTGKTVAQLVDWCRGE
jgi:hypothetical protein